MKKNINKTNKTNTNKANTITIDITITQESDNDILEEVVSSMVTEAINHFTKTSRPRNYHNDDDNRYFYTKEEIESFKSQYKGPAVNIYTIIDECDGSVFCYEITRLH